MVINRGLFFFRRHQTHSFRHIFVFSYVNVYACSPKALKCRRSKLGKNALNENVRKTSFFFLYDHVNFFFLSNKIYLQSTLLCTISEFDNIIYVYKQRDACDEWYHPAMEPGAWNLNTVHNDNTVLRVCIVSILFRRLMNFRWTISTR